MAKVLDTDEELVATIKNADGIILAVTENLSWIEVVFDGGNTHIKTVICSAASCSELKSKWHRI